MFKLWMARLGLLLCVTGAQAQYTSIDEVLRAVESNNLALKSFRSHLESETWNYKAENTLPAPQFSAYYLPFGRHESGNYTEFEVSQRVEFPTVYAARAAWIDEQEDRQEAAYSRLRQDILLQARKLSLEWIHLEKLRVQGEVRMAQSRTVYEHVQVSFEKGQTGILDLNKARIVALDQQFALEELVTRKDRIAQELRGLNGGGELILSLEAYPDPMELPPPDSLWNERMRRDAGILLLEREKAVAEQRIKVERNQLLPDIIAGYNYQGVAGTNYSGFYGGLNIPLWQGKRRVRVVEAQIEYIEKKEADFINSLRTEYLSMIERYDLLLGNFRAYQEAMDGLESETLLQKSYQLGEISFLDYYREIAFYRAAQNRMLEMERELHELRSEIFKYSL